MFSYVNELLSSVVNLSSAESVMPESTPAIVNAANSLIKDTFDDDQIEMERKGRRLQEWTCLHLCNFLYRSESGEELLFVIRNLMKADVQVKEIYSAIHDEEEKNRLMDLVGGTRSEIELVLKLVGKEIDRINELLL
ncbi:predicted protein [Naegleria gruberi]|uniref:Predicted protein n=1 Tax=Naegleria gruberi TaxID=5762 RepID=D2V6V8_NAEGR|nr:uncharacterized protein NAEGRDRAFT_64573 [Naegleria gruberi]EFC47514.1 predicted protein [Naegleria gruberi]|eukprot:XP_002680258.1 predicted protein [Naegleria gruberi strain NEG-M]